MDFNDSIDGGFEEFVAALAGDLTQGGFSLKGAVVGG